MMREEVLKELELWPVWSLRRPLALQPKALETMPEVSAPEENLQIEKALEAVTQEEVVQVAQTHLAEVSTLIDSHTYLSFQTENADCLVLHQDHDFSQEEEKLWLNICKAMQFSQKMHIQRATIRTLLENQRPKVIIIFGEQIAQSILPSADLSSENMPSIENIPCVVTFSLAHLLLNPLDKGQTWRNLCQALALLG